MSRVLNTVGPLLETEESGLLKRNDRLGKGGVKWHVSLLVRNIFFQKMHILAYINQNVSIKTELRSSE